MALTPPSFLFAWEAEDGSLTPRWGANAAVHTRASTGEHQRVDGTTVQMPANRPRYRWVQDPETGLYTRRALVLEPARTNAFTYSNDFTQAVYGKPGLTVSAASVVSPFGLLDATAIVDDGTAGARYLYRDPTLTDNTVYTFSVFLKKLESSNGFLQVANKAGATSQAQVNFDTGAITTSGAASGAMGGGRYVGGGWYWLWAAVNTATGAYAPRVYFGPTSPGASVSGKRMTAVFGLQCEQASFPTSYVPTTASTAPRSADALHWTTAPDPQAMAVYLRFTERGEKLSAGSRQLLTFGPVADNTHAHLKISQNNSNLNFFFHPVDGPNYTYAQLPTGTLNWSYGDTVEIMLTLSAANAGRLAAAKNLGAVAGLASTVQGTVSASFPTKWATNELHLSKGAGQSDSTAADWEAVRIAKLDDLDGATDRAKMEEMRTTTLEIGGNLVRTA